MSQCIRNKVGSSLWKSCLKQPSLEILQNANLNVLLVIIECISHGCCGKRIDFSIDIIRRAGYQSWDCHVGSHNHHFCTLSQSFEKLCFSLKRWGSFKVMIGPNLLHCTRFLLYGSGLHATYHGRSAKRIYIWSCFDLTNYLKYLMKEFRPWIILWLSRVTSHFHFHGAWKMFCSGCDCMV